MPVNYCEVRNEWNKERINEIRGCWKILSEVQRKRRYATYFWENAVISSAMKAESDNKCGKLQQKIASIFVISCREKSQNVIDFLLLYMV